MRTTDPSAVEPTATKGIPVDLESYPRRRLYDCVRHHPLPVLAISTAMNITGYSAALEARGLGFYTTLCCLISKAIHTSACFRHRIVDGVLVEFPLVHPSINVALEDDGFSVADATTSGVFHEDYASLRTAMDAARARPNQDFAAAWTTDPDVEAES